MGSSRRTSASWTAVLEAFSEVRALSHQLGTQQRYNVFSANAVLKACNKARQWQRAAAVCALTAAQTLRPDVATCSSVICATGHGKMWQEAFAWLVCFCSSALEVNEIVYNSLLGASASSLSVRWSSSVSIFKDFLKMQLRKDVISFNSLITCRSRAWRMACLLLQQCQDLSVETTQISLGASVSACQKCMEWRTALRITRSLRRNMMSSVMRNSAVSACTNAGAWQHAASLAGEQNLPFDHFTMNALMYCPGVQWRSALHTAKWMKLPWDLVTYNTALQVHGESRRWESSLHLAQELLMVYLQPSSMTFSGLMLSCRQTQAWQASFAFCNQMGAQNLEANILLYNAVMSAQEQSSQWTGTLELQQRNQDMGIQLSVVSFGCIINACEKDRCWRLALAVTDVLSGRSLEFLRAVRIVIAV